MSDPSAEPPEPDPAEPAAAESPPSGRGQIKTVLLDPRDVRPSWPMAIATLEQLAEWGPLALRLGILALIQACVRELAEQTASAESIAQLRLLTDALAHMPLET